MRERDIPFKTPTRNGHIIEGRIFVELGRDFQIGSENPYIKSASNFEEILTERRGRKTTKGLFKTK